MGLGNCFRRHLVDQLIDDLTLQPGFIWRFPLLGLVLKMRKRDMQKFFIRMALFIGCQNTAFTGPIGAGQGNIPDVRIGQGRCELFLIDPQSGLCGRCKFHQYAWLYFIHSSVDPFSSLGCPNL